MRIVLSLTLAALICAASAGAATYFVRLRAGGRAEMRPLLVIR